MPFACREKKNAHSRDLWARRRARFFDGKVCVACGSTDELELHHRDPEQKVNHRIWSWTEGRRLAELAKCEVRCHTCHVAGHAVDRIVHGGSKRYDKGCRCDLCRAGKSAKNAKYRRPATA